jgi:hypothetical protein
MDHGYIMQAAHKLRAPPKSETINATAAKD